jgi:outer membrane protein assembly factor BamD (BamD/ComL family)
LTRKSQPKSDVHRMAWLVLASCVWGIVAGGCSLFSPAKSSLTDYETARQAINNPIIVNNADGADGSYDDDAYRPEGASVEKSRGKKDWLSDVGFGKRAAKVNKDLARSQFAEAQALYEQAIALPLDERKPMLRDAAEKFKSAAGNWKSSALEQDALYWAVESHFLAEDYYQAEHVISKLNKEYPRNPYLDQLAKRQWEIYDYWMLTNTARPRPFFVVNFSDRRFPWNDTGGYAKKGFEKMRLENPTGKLSDDATMRLAVEQFRKGDFEGAADTFADVRLTYPDSEHLFNAQMLELESLVRSYQGPQYTSLPLTEAEKRVKQIVRQFPVEAQEHQQELNQTYAKIRFLNAERYWEYAELRRRAQANGSAKHHYLKLVEEYSETPFAEQALARLEEIRDLPADPPQYFRPLVKLFGADTGAKPWDKGNDGQQ